MIDKNIFSERFKILRDSAGMSMADIARNLDLSKQAVDAWDKQKNIPSADKLIELAKILNSSVDYLCGVSDTPDIHTENVKQISQSQLIFDAQDPEAKLFLLLDAYRAADEQNRDAILKMALEKVYLSNDEAATLERSIIQF
jgi:transcriptional regulator with XRE-family HTH domain